MPDAHSAVTGCQAANRTYNLEGVIYVQKAG
jgi:hypothetical protein